LGIETDWEGDAVWIVIMARVRLKLDRVFVRKDLGSSLFRLG
jgi:hypothetical protein